MLGTMCFWFWGDDDPRRFGASGTSLHFNVLSHSVFKRGRLWCSIARSFFRGHAGPAGGRDARGRRASGWPGGLASADGRGYGNLRPPFRVARNGLKSLLSAYY